MKTLKIITLIFACSTIPLLLALIVISMIKGSDYESPAINTIGHLWILSFVLIGVAWGIAFRKDVVENVKDFIK